MKEGNQIAAWSHCGSEYLQAGRWGHIVGNLFKKIMLKIVETSLNSSENHMLKNIHTS